MSRGPYAPSDAGSGTGQAGRPQLQPRVDDAELAPASIRHQSRPAPGAFAVRETGLVFVTLALIALRLLYDQVNGVPPHDPTAAELALGFLTFTSGAFGTAALWFGEELFR